MMTQLYWIGSLLLFANGISTSEENVLEKTHNGIQGGMMMTVKAKTGKGDSSHKDKREDFIKAALSQESMNVDTPIPWNFFNFRPCI